MKKFLYILMIALLFLTGCSSKEAKEGNVTYISLDEYVEKIQTDDKFVVVIGNVECSACVRFKPILEEINKNKGTEIFYVQIDNSKWTKEQKEELVTKTQELLNVEIQGTPTSLIIDNKEAKTVAVGYQEYSDFLEVLEDYGIVES